MEAKDTLRHIRARGGLTRLELARLANVAPSTIARIENGKSKPSRRVMSAILLSSGYQVIDGLKRSGDVSAVCAARVALGELRVQDIDANTRVWLERWNRAGLLDDELRVRNVDKLAALAGIAAPLFGRPGRRVSVTHDRPWQEVAAQLSLRGHRYAVSGITATSKTRSKDGAAWPVVYVDDPEKAATELGLTPAKRGAVLTLLPFDFVSAIGTVEEDGVTWVSAGQALVDSYAGPGRMPDKAEAVAAHWQQALESA